MFEQLMGLMADGAGGFLFIAIFFLILCLGALAAWTVTELPQMIRDSLEFRRWRKSHSRVFY